MVSTSGSRSTAPSPGWTGATASARWRRARTGCGSTTCPAATPPSSTTTRPGPTRPRTSSSSRAVGMRRPGTHRAGGAAHLTGLVRGSTGTGIEGAEVTAYVEQDGAWIPFTTIMTAANGRYDLGGLPGGAYKLGFHDPATGVTEYWNDKASLADADTLNVQNAGSNSGLDAELGNAAARADHPADLPPQGDPGAEPHAASRPDLDHHGSARPAGRAGSGRADDDRYYDDREGRDGEAPADQGRRRGGSHRAGDPVGPGTRPRSRARSSGSPTASASRGPRRPASGSPGSSSASGSRCGWWPRRRSAPSLS